MLARLAALLEPPVRPVISARLDEMKELHIARRALVKDRTAATNREHTRRSALLKRQAAQRLAQIERQIIAIDKAVRDLLAGDVELKARFDILVSIPGVGETTAMALLIEMPELGGLEHGCVASLPAWRLSRGTPASIATSASSEAGAPACAKPSTCQPWSPYASIQI